MAGELRPRSTDSGDSSEPERARRGDVPQGEAGADAAAPDADEAGGRESADEREDADLSGEPLTDRLVAADIAERQRRERIDQLAQSWRRLDLGDLLDDPAVRDLPPFAEVCDLAHRARIPPMLMYAELMDPRSRPNAEVFERLGYRLRDDDERWVDVAELIQVLRAVLPDSRVARLIELEQAREYLVQTPIVGPNDRIGVVTTTWRADENGDDGSPRLIDIDVQVRPTGSAEGAS
ncbi:MAG TPA: hypothetical protein VI076_00680 [Actinopolymorphaceae bacterium]